MKGRLDYFLNALEMAAKSLARVTDEHRVLVGSVGYFGDLFADIFTSQGIAVERIRVGDGKPLPIDILEHKLEERHFDVVAVTHNETSTGLTNDLYRLSQAVREHDALFVVDAVSSLGGIPINVVVDGIDFLVTSPQKCLGVPPGLGIAIVNERAIERASQVPNRGYTTDLLGHVKADKKDQTLATPPLAQIEALYAQLKYILHEEGAENRYQRHHDLGERTRAWALENGFQLFPVREYASDTVTCVSNTRGEDLAGLQMELGRQGYGFDPCYRALNESQKRKGLPDTFRIAHMGDRTMDQLETYLSAVSAVLKK